MNLTNAQVFMLYHTLNNLSKEKFNIKTSFNIARNIQILKPIVQSICDVRDCILSDLPKVGATIEQTEAAQSKFNDLENIKIDLDLYKIKMSELESIQLTPQDVEFLIPIFLSEED